MSSHPNFIFFMPDQLRADTVFGPVAGRARTPNLDRFAEDGIVVRDNQLHTALPKNDFSAYTEGFDPAATHLSIDSHGQAKGARPRSVETYFGPRIGSLGPDWSKDIPLAPNHHFVIEYFFYMPSPGGDGEDQYLLWWKHEEAIATESGIEYLSPPQQELLLIRPPASP